MKPYLLFMTNLPTAPLQGQNPRGEAKTQEFIDLADAQSIAEKEKNNWECVVVYKKQEGYDHEMIEQYRKGRKYHPDGQSWC